MHFLGYVWNLFTLKRVNASSLADFKPWFHVKIKNKDFYFRAAAIGRPS